MSVASAIANAIPKRSHGRTDVLTKNAITLGSSLALVNAHETRGCIE